MKRPFPLPALPAPCLWRWAALVIALAAWGGCAKNPPVDEGGRVDVLEERLDRAEQQLTRLQDSVNTMKTAGTETGPTNVTEKLTRFIVTKLGTNARGYNTNGGLITLRLDADPRNGMGFKKPDRLVLGEKSIPLPDLALCTTSQNKKFFPPGVDLVVSPDGELALLNFPCAASGERLYLIHMGKGTVIHDEFTGEFFTLSSAVWSPDAAYLLIETCKATCNVTLVDATGSKVDLTPPPVFGYKSPADTEAQQHPNCRVGGGVWSNNTAARLKLECAQPPAPVPLDDPDVEFTMDVDLDLVEHTITIVQ